jgi:hypothetical protein
MLQRLPVDQAARELGLSVATVKRRLKRGTLRGEQERTPAGFKWYVLVDGAATAGATAGATADGGAGGADGGAAATAPGALLSQRAEEMARYSRELLAPYVEKIEAQAERFGRLEAELAAYRQAEGQRDAPPAESQTGRSWWWRLLWG